MHVVAPETVAWVARLAEHGTRPALHDGSRTLTYTELVDEVERRGRQLGSVPRLVAVTMTNTVDAVAWYLAALSGGHRVIVGSGRDHELTTVVERYDPDVVIHDGTLVERRPETRHELHPELAVLLSTSGTTGSPRLVRLSAENVQANAESIATYLDVTPDDVAITALPLTYCYGLSILHVHLLRGASVVLTDLSVVDPCFWGLVDRHGVTSISGVPHTFDMLDRAGFDRRDVPSLRYLTQAGGRMRPEQVTRYAELGASRGFDLIVMYGQTEATARMAYLPPERVLEHPDCIGVAIPGGHLRLDRSVSDDPEVGELVYEGPNVMLGYADHVDDLALGRTVDALRTGDLAREVDGLYRIVGRSARFTKIFGLRIDLDGLERDLEASCGPVAVAATDDRLVVAATDPAGAAALDEQVRRITGLPAHTVSVETMDEVPRLPSGKPDYAAVANASVPEVRPRALRSVAGIYAEMFGQAVSCDDSFVSLGGDSLSYVEASVRIEEVLGHLPDHWHLLPVSELDATSASGARRRRGQQLDASIALRALAILAIVATHANLATVVGGAHLLLILVGYNAGRFLIDPSTSAPGPSRKLLRAATRVVIPAVLWISAVTIVAGTYPWRSVFLVNGLIGPTGWSEPAWHYWFIEALVVTLVFLAALLAVPGVRRLDARWPFWFPVAVATVALLTRYDVVELRGGDEIHRASVVFWLVALGWAASRAASTRHRLVVSALLAATVPGFFDDPWRDAIVVAGGLALVWIGHVTVPRLVGTAMSVLASASLYIYLTHWQVYPHWEDSVPVLATGLSLVVGIVAWRIATAVERSATARVANREIRSQRA